MKKNGSPEPQFRTDDDYSFFVTILPIYPTFLSDEGVNEGVKDIVNLLLLNVSGLNAIEITARINKSQPTTERYLRLLRKKGIVEFKGAAKTGGYHLTEVAKKRLT